MGRRSGKDYAVMLAGKINPEPESIRFKLHGHNSTKERTSTANKYQSNINETMIFRVCTEGVPVYGERSRNPEIW